MRLSTHAAALLTIAVMPALGQATATDLRCEHLSNPLGIDVARPRLTWQMRDARPGAAQTAYRIEVASSRERLASGKPDFWDSKKVVSSETVDIEYGGRECSARKRYWWRVRIWDRGGKESKPSAPAFWEMGLLSKADWKARWIGGPEQESEQSVSLDGVRWVWYPEGEPEKDAPSGRRVFRANFELPAGRAVEDASFYVAADNSFVVFVNGIQVGEGGGWQSLGRFDVKRNLVEGKNVIAASVTNDGGPAGLLGVLQVRLAGGQILRRATRFDWKAFKPDSSRIRALTIADYDDSSWPNVKEIAEPGGGPWGPVGAPSMGGQAALLRKTFEAPARVVSARVYVTALGSYRLHINGRRVGRDVLTPDWTDYRKRILYQTYDVTSLVRQGENAIAAMVGDGWYSSGLGWGLQRNLFGPPPNRFLAQLHMTLRDGSERVIATGPDWLAAPAPVLRSEIYAGETYDARREVQDWDKPGELPGWKPVRAFEMTAAKITAQISPPNRVTQVVKPVKITTPSPGVTIFDMGQNMVGWARLRAKAPAGTAIRLRFAEILKPDGNIYTENLRRAEATDTYICKGSGEEVWEPHFTYHGFRYVEVTGLPETPTLETVEGQVVHTDAPRTSKFETSNAMVNKLWENIQWGQRGNLVSVPTDCPQRDERLGWMGDAQIFWRTACLNMDLASFTRKWSRDVVEAQSEAGAFSDVSPRVVDLADGAPAWGDAGIIVPYESYRAYGDRRLIAEMYEPMKKWLEYIHKANPELLWLRQRNNDFGDWVPANSETPKEVLASAYWAYDAQLMARMADALGKPEDARKYLDLYRGIREAFIKRYVKPDGTVGNGSQTCQVMALFMSLCPAELREKVASVLVADIEKRGGHLSTGFLGSSYLMPALSDNGQHQTAVKLLLNTTYPSWGYTISKGATTIWERWNGDTGDPSMNSFNHYAFGAVGEWMVRRLAGIDTSDDHPGYRRILIRPMPDGRLDHVRAEYDSIRGKIVSGWKKADNGWMVYEFTIPPNGTASVELPGTNYSMDAKRGKSGPTSAIVVDRTSGVIRFTAGAGTYRIHAQ